MKQYLRKRNIKVFSLILVIVTNSIGFSQTEEVYSLKKCIDLAISRNTELKKKSLSVKYTTINYENSKTSLLPSISFQAIPSFNLGRSLDPYSNQFINRKIESFNGGLNASYLLFDHHQRANNIEQQSINDKIASQDYQIEKNKLIVDITQAYLQVMLQEEIYSALSKQLELTSNQVKIISEKVKINLLARSELLMIQSQQSLDKLNLINSKNNILRQYYELHQLMNLPNFIKFKVDHLEHLNFVRLIEEKNTEVLFKQIIKGLPQAFLADYRVQYNDIELETAKAARFPTITLGVGYFTTYSSAAPKQRFISNGGEKQTIELPTDKYIFLNNQKQYVFEPIELPNGYYKQSTFINQLFTNSYANIGLTIRVPIFNVNQASRKIQLAEINKQISKIEALEVRNQFQQHLEELVFKLESLEEKYNYLNEKLKAFESVMIANSEKYREGIANFQEFLTAKTNYERSISELLQAKYELYFNQKILRFYLGKFTN